MKLGSTLILKLAVIVMALPVLALCIFAVPAIGKFVAELYPEMPYIKYYFFIIPYGSVIPFYFALYQTLKLLGYIERNEAFSELSVQVLGKIKYCAIVISGFYVLGMPIFYLVARRVDPPGVPVIGLLFIFASLVVAVFAAVLQQLLKEAIDIKSENDLTV